MVHKSVWDVTASLPGTAFTAQDAVRSFGDGLKLERGGSRNLP